MAVRPTRVRRLRAHRAVQAITVVVGLLLLSGVVHFALRKHVTLVVDGKSQAVQTTSSNVHELLTGEGISLTSSERARPVPAAMAFFSGATQFEQPYGAIAAAAVIVTIPVVIMVLLFQRKIVAGLTSGAVKG